MPHVSSCLSTAVTTTKHRRAPVVPTEFPALFQERNLRGNGKGEERKCMKGKNREGAEELQNTEGEKGQGMIGRQRT